MFESAGPAGPLVDKERDICLEGKGMHPEVGSYYMLTYQGKKIPFEADVIQLDHPSNASKELIWVIKRLGFGVEYYGQIEGHQSFKRKSFTYRFLSADEEREVARIVVEALTANRAQYGQGAPVSEVRFQEDAWQFGPPPPGEFAIADVDDDT